MPEPSTPEIASPGPISKIGEFTSRDGQPVGVFLASNTKLLNGEELQKLSRGMETVSSGLTLAAIATTQMKNGF